jgi:hypothetical protein
MDENRASQDFVLLSRGLTIANTYGGLDFTAGFYMSRA